MENLDCTVRCLPTDASGVGKRILSDDQLTEYFRHFEQMEEIINSCAPYSRNARLALLELYASNTKEPAANIEQKHISACVRHFQDFATKHICFNDLQPSLARLSDSNQLVFLKLVQEKARDLKPVPGNPEVRAPIHPLLLSKNTPILTFNLEVKSCRVDHRRDQCSEV